MIQFSKIGKDDIKQCIDIYFAAFDNILYGSSINDILHDFQSRRTSFLEQYFLECIDREDRYAFCIKDGADIVGIIIAWDRPSPEPGEIIYVDTIAVAPEHQRKGYGTALINEFIRTVSGEKLLILNTKKNIPAYELYKKLGFYETEFVTMQKSPLLDKLMAEREELNAKIKKLKDEQEEILKELENKLSSEK